MAVMRYVVMVAALTGTAWAQAPPSASDIAALRAKAERGDAKAQTTLGAMYANGRGVPKDDLFAYMWANLAAAHAPADKQKAFSDFRDQVEQRLSPQQRADGQRMAREWQAAFEKRQAQRK